MPRVVFVNRYFYPDHSATSQLLSDLCFRLADSGVDVAVVTSRCRYDGSQSSTQLPGQDRIGNVSVYRCRCAYFGSGRLLGRAVEYIAFYLAASARLLSVLKPRDLVVCMTDPPLLGVVLLPVVRLRRGEIVNWLQDLFPEVAESLQVKGLRGPLASTIRYLRNISCRSAALNVAVGERMSQYLRNNGINQEKLTVIPNWAPVDLHPVRREINELHREWFSGEYFVVGYSGNLGRAHDWQTIFQCMEALRANGRIRFLMIGSGIGMDKLGKAVEAAGLTNVLFEPYQPLARLAESLSASDVHMVSLQPGVSDYLVPSKVYGIAAVARPMLYIGEEESEIGDMLHCYNFGVMVRPGDSGALAEKILYLFENPEELQLMGERGRRMYEDNYSAPRAHAAWQKLLGEMV